MPVFAAGLLHAASFEDRIAALFRPSLGEMMALSPDGERVAYTAPADGRLTLVLMSVDSLGRKRTIELEPAPDATNPKISPPMRLRFLRWATPTRLVFAPVEQVVPLPPVTDPTGRTQPNPDGPTIVSPIMVVDADSRQFGTLIDASHFQETPAEARLSLGDLLRTPQELAARRNEPIHWRMPHLDILGVHPQDREQLIIGTRGAYSMPAQHLVDIRTGNVREFGIPWPTPPGEPQIFDWFRLKVAGERQPGTRPSTRWHDPVLDKVQQELAAKFPRRVVELLDWSETCARVLCRVSGGNDPGRVFVYQRPEDLVVEILRRAPWLDAAKLHETRFFEFTADDGAQLSGYFTWPNHVGLPAEAGAAPPPLVVVFPADLTGPAQPAFDPGAEIFADFGFAVARLNYRSVAGARPEERVLVDDARAAISWLAARRPARPFDREQVAVLGRNFGGYLALRARELEPTVFRCGLAMDASADLRASWPPPEPASAHLALGTDFSDASPSARAAIYRQIVEFLHAQMPAHPPGSGPAKEVE